MFKATTAAAALLPIQKNPNLFHILINPCEFLIESRASSWGPGALGSRAAGGPEGLGLIAGTEKRFTMSASGVITGTGGYSCEQSKTLPAFRCLQPLGKCSINQTFIQTRKNPVCL